MTSSIKKIKYLKQGLNVKIFLVTSSVENDLNIKIKRTSHCNPGGGWRVVVCLGLKQIFADAKSGTVFLAPK